MSEILQVLCVICLVFMSHVRGMRLVFDEDSRSTASGVIGGVNCYKQNTNLPGGTIQTISLIENILECNTLCRDTGSCVAFVWFSKRDCQLKDSTHGPPVPAAVGVESIASVIDDCEMSDKRENEKVLFPTREAMQSWRQRIISGRTTDNQSRRKVRLLFRIIGEKFYDYTETESPKVVEKNDDEQQKAIENAEDTSCHFLKRTDLPGGTIREFWTAGARGCRARCSNMKGVCVAYTFLTTQNRCRVKNKEHDIASNDNWEALEAKAVSGFMSCEDSVETDESKDKCIQKHMYYPGQKIISRTLKSIDECRQFCSTVPSCAGVNFKFDSGDCILVTKYHGNAVSMEGWYISLMKCQQITKKLDEFESAILDSHNIVRAIHGSGNLTWNDNVATFAQNWCKKLSDEDGFEHSPGSAYGENLYKSVGRVFDSTKTARDTVGAWYSEVKNWDFSTSSKKTGMTGHFTQIVWKSTTELGCGIGVKDSTIVVCCNYSPPGNYFGRYVAEVPRNISCWDDSCESGGSEGTSNKKWRFKWQIK